LSDRTEKLPPDDGFSGGKQRWITRSNCSGENLGRGSDLDICAEFIRRRSPGVGELGVEVGEEANKLEARRVSLGRQSVLPPKLRLRIC
jgi:hypothetical protein